MGVQMLTTRRPWWDWTAFAVIVSFGAQGTYRYLSHDGSLGWSLNLAIALVVGGLLVVACSLILDELRKRFGQ